MLKEEIIDLWRSCFDDTEEFIRFYFERKYREENTIALKENGKVICALQMLPYTMTWDKTEVPVSYISGASTYPEARNKGCMRKLLTEAFLLMKNRKFAFSILIPQENWLYEYYARMGYAPVFRYTPENYYLPVPRKHPNVKVLQPEEYSCLKQELYNYFDSQMHKRPNSIQHSAEDFNIILDELYLSEGRLLVFKHTSGRWGGMAFAVPFPDKVIISELLYNSEEEKGALLNTAACYWHKNEIESKIPPRSGHTARRGMARVIDAPQILGTYAATHPRHSVLLYLSDEFLPSNTGYYRLKNGKVFRTGSGVQRPDLSVDIYELTRMLFNHPAYISLMLD